MSSSFYITTPIYYPNGQPHLGHVYTTLAADVLARYHRLGGDDTWFLTGTDEHGIKMVKTADDLNTTPQALADENSREFASLWKELDISNDDFIRTSSPRHKAGVTEIVNQMLASGDIYLGSYEGWYDEGQEEFITETEAKAAEYKSAVSGRALVRYSEGTYFFKLTKYVDRVYAAIENDEIRVLPASRKNEILSKLKGWAADLSISRSSLRWGIPMPNDSEHVLYVWIDALSNYITALDYTAGGAPSQFNKYWPANVHLIGKEILWFHAFYWPAMLMSLGLPLPKTLFAHGWWTSDGKKMSKSMGNFIDLDRVRQTVATYTLSGLRYYLLRAAPFGADLDWKEAELNSAYTELGNVVGNLLNRTLNMIGKYRNGVVPAAPADDAADATVKAELDAFPAALAKAYGELELQRAALLPVELARAANVFIDQTQPFKLAKDPAQAARLDAVLWYCVQVCKTALAGLLPVLGEKSVAGLKQLNIDPAGQTLTELLTTRLPAGHQLGTAQVLFPKLV